MGQMGFFDISKRYAGLDAKNDPLVKIDEVVGWADFRPRLDAVWRKPAEERKSPAGRKPWDAVVMFKAIVLCELYNLSDDQVEYQLRDRLSFMRFLGLCLEDKVPDAKTVWLYREQLAQAGMIETLFEDFDGYLEKQGYLAMGGQIIDASIVPVPKQRNSRDDNARIKDGETPEGWEDQPAKRSQKDTDARWTKKHGKSHYGYKNHVNVDRRHKLVRRMDLWRAQTAPDLSIDAMIRLMQKWKPLAWAQERGVLDKALGPFLQRRMNEEKAYFHLVRLASATDKVTRAQSVLGRISMGKIRFPGFEDWWPALQSELVRFPHGKHDDQVDAMSLIGRMLAGMTPERLPDEGLPPGTPGLDIYSGQSSAPVKEHRPMTLNDLWDEEEA